MFLTNYRLSFLLAWRFLWSANREPAVCSMVRICFVGILIGAGALALVSAVMQGFESATRTQLQSIHPTIMIRAGDQTINEEKISAVLTKEFPEVIAHAPVIEHYAMVDGADAVVQVRGIDPAHEQHVTALNKMVLGDFVQSFSALCAGTGVVIGYKLAQQLGLAVGDHLNLVYVQDLRDKKQLEKVMLTVRGLIKTGIDEFDTGLVLARYDFVRELFPELGATYIGIKLVPGIDEMSIAQRMRARIPLEITTWHELYPALLAALKIEKYLMFLVMMLISLVASMTIISLIFMLITQKRAVIALLRACGFSLKHVQVTFMTIGVLVGALAASAGLLLALCAGLVLRSYPLIKLPDVYYSQYLPVVIQPSLFVLVLCVVILMCICATLVPLRRISSLVIADVLRFEG